MVMIHCQNCTTRNSLNREFCWKCGTKLLVASGAVPFDPAMPFMEEHVLERISALEYSINTLTKRVDSLMETIERVAASTRPPTFSLISVALCLCGRLIWDCESKMHARPRQWLVVVVGIGLVARRRQLVIAVA